MLVIARGLLLKKVDGHPGGSMAGSSQKLIGYQELYHAGYQGLP